MTQALDDLNAVVTRLSADVKTEIDALTTAIADEDDAGVEAAVANLSSLADNLEASVKPPVAPVTPVAPATPAAPAG